MQDGNHVHGVDHNPDAVVKRYGIKEFRLLHIGNYSLKVNTDAVVLLLYLFESDHFDNLLLKDRACILEDVGEFARLAPDLSK